MYLEIATTALSLVHKVFLLKKDKTIAWVTGIVASVLSIIYFYIVGLNIYSGLEIGLTVLMLYGLMKNKTRRVENIITVFTGLLCIFLGYLSLSGFLTVLELVSSIIPLLAIYFLTNNKNKLGWMCMVATCLITTYVVFEKGQFVFAVYQIISLLLAIYGLVRSFIVIKDEEVHIVSYDPNWIKKFNEEKELIEKTIDSFITGGVHHVGSTSVPRLSAKPIIDIMVGVESLEKAKPCIESLSKIDYCYYPYKPELMHWFCKPSPEYRTHHLYLIETSNPEFKARLAFRDYLISHPEKAKEYEELKLKLADEFKDDREAYTQAKTDFIKEITRLAME